MSLLLSLMRTTFSISLARGNGMSSPMSANGYKNGRDWQFFYLDRLTP